MRVPHLVVDDRAPVLAVGADTDHHLRKVLRLRDGAAVTVTDGRGGVADAELTTAGLAVVGPWRRADSRAPSVTLWAAIGKGTKFDLVVEKATELGVAAIRPILCERGERHVAKQRRWETIARSAVEQSRGAWLPEIGEPLAFGDAVAAGCGILLHPGAGGGARLLLLASPAHVAVGPEGGFTETEVASASAAGWTVCGLGPRVLRTETAAVVAAALAVAAAGGLDAQDLPDEVSKTLGG